jgi:hypothetical protein
LKLSLHVSSEEALVSEDVGGGTSLHPCDVSLAVSVSLNLHVIRQCARQLTSKRR